MPRKKITLAIIVSTFNEVENLPLLYRELTKVWSRLKGINPSVIFVDDGSTDSTTAVLKRLAQKDRRIKIITLTRNFGHEAAMMAGIDHTTADLIVCMDADLQHHPKWLSSMVAAYQKGHHLVLMKRKITHPLSPREIFTQCFYWLYNLVNHDRLEANVTDFFLISSQVAATLRQEYRERRRFLRAILQSLWAHPHLTEFTPLTRAHGHSKYNLTKLIELSFQSLLSYSPFALHLCLFFSGSLALFSILLIIFSIVMWAIGNTIPGYTTLVVFMSGMAAMQFLILGIMSHYLGILIHEVKNRPLYIIDKTQ